MTYKEEMLIAIRTVIRNYEAKINDHTLEKCPLCKRYYTETDPTEDKLADCIACPNTVFGKHDYNRPCHERGNMFIGLDFVSEENSDTLADYWRLVEALIESKTDEEVQEMGPYLQAEILEIAKGFDTEELN